MVVLALFSVGYRTQIYFDMIMPNKLDDNNDTDRYRTEKNKKAMTKTKKEAKTGANHRMLINVITRELNFIQHHHQQFPRINVLFPFCLPDTSCVVYRERKHTTDQVYHVPLTERYVTVSPQVVVNCCCCCCSHINSHIIICSIPWSQDRLQSQLWN